MDAQLRDWLIEYHKGAYEFQLDRHEKTRERISFLVGLLSALGGAIIYLLSNYPYSTSAGATLFYLPMGLSIIFFFEAIGLIFYCLGRGFNIGYLPPPTEIQEFAERLAKYSEDYPQSKMDALSKVKEHINKLYCKAATANEPINLKRSRLLLFCVRVGLLSFILLLFSLPKFFFEQAGKEEKPTKVIFSETVRITK